MNRRQLMMLGCGHCVGAWSGFSHAVDAPWSMPDRFAKPDLSSDEGGLWAQMDREEQRLRRSPLMLRDGGLRSYLQSLACKLGGAHCQDVRVYPLRTPLFNATMAPNGMMQVWSGLLLRVDNEAQLSAVLGHEIGHYLQRHSLDRIRDIKSRTAFSQLLGVALGGAAPLADLVLLAGAAAFSRDQERHADGIGLSLMTAQGLDPRQASVVWQNLRLELSAGAGGDPSKRSVLFASHPSSKEREESLASMADAMARKTNNQPWVTREEEYLQVIQPYLLDLLDDELRRGQYDETIVLMDRWVKKDGKRSETLYCRGEARRLRAQGEDIDMAVQDFKLAVEGRESLARGLAWRGLGFVHQQRNQSSQARSAFERYIALSPNAPDVGLIQNYLQTAP
jgi:beta-barrel assembly-enhancing protease